jgi:hypothetical protein
MKKLILSFLAAALLLSTVPSYAWNRGGNGYNGSYGHRGGYNNNYRGGYNNNWIAPAIGGLIIGGIVGSALTSPYYAPAPVYAQPAPVYIQRAPEYMPPPPAPEGYHYEQMLDNNCNCYITIMVPN